jgi:methionyl-tRNA formyltransferase
MRLLLVAEESAGTRILTEISKLRYDVLAVMTTEPPDGTHVNCVWNCAKTLGYKVWPAGLVKDPSLPDQIKRAGVDLILNVHSLYVINEGVLSAARIGAFNLHPGPLPQYAGLNAPSWAIYRGEKKHAVTLHKMEPRVDAGDIVFEECFDISDADTGLSVALRCVQLGIPLVLKLLELASEDPQKIPHRSQNLGERRYFGKRAPHDGKIPWDRSARQVFDFIRASDYAPFHSPWGRPRTSYNGQEIAVTKAALSGQKADRPPGYLEAENGRFYAACSDEWLEIRKLYQDGRNMSPQECLSIGGRFAQC